MASCLERSNAPAISGDAKAFWHFGHHTNPPTGRKSSSICVLQSAQAVENMAVALGPGVRQRKSGPGRWNALAPLSIASFDHVTANEAVDAYTLARLPESIPYLLALHNSRGPATHLHQSKRGTSDSGTKNGGPAEPLSRARRNCVYRWQYYPRQMHKQQKTPRPAQPGRSCGVLIARRRDRVCGGS